MTKQIWCLNKIYMYCNKQEPDSNCHYMHIVFEFETVISEQFYFVATNKLLTSVTCDTSLY